MQTYVVHWQFPNQEAHIKGCDAFAEYLENGAEYDKFEGLYYKVWWVWRPARVRKIKK